LKQVLEALLALQKIDTQLLQLEALKGDLPNQVKRLHQELADAEQQLVNHEKKLAEYRRETGILEMDLRALESKGKVYQNQLYEVKTNREYDAVTHEIESVKSEIGKRETRQLELMETIEGMEKTVGEAKKSVALLKGEFEQKKAALEKRQEATERDELALKDKRGKLTRGIDSKVMTSYERIRNAKNGLAIVSVVRNACGGCHKTLPPQKVLEIRDMERLYLCETCGRMLVWDEAVSGQTE
jgi:predicted  nucleic acid-binding Zn-ribbon protein